MSAAGFHALGVRNPILEVVACFFPSGPADFT